MKEKEIRRLFHEAIGEPRRLSRADLDQQLARGGSPRRFLAVGQIAATVVIVAVAGFTAWGLLNQHSTVGPVEKPPAAGHSGPQPARVAAAMGYDEARQQVVLFGGTELGASSALADTWIWNGKAWSKRTAAPSPPPRQEAGMAYDAVRKELLLFGGVDADGTPYQDTWIWDGSTWQPRQPAVSPPARRDPAIAFDEALQKIVMFGGWNPQVGGAAKLNDTWTWDGTAWTQLHPATVPAKRGSAVMAYDLATRQLVMFGGDTGSGTNETWVFDGTTWTRLATTTSPSPRESTAMALQPNGQLVMFGGEAPVSAGFVGPHADTWIWDGKNWIQQHPLSSPPARGMETLAGNMVYDAALGVDVLYSGIGAGPNNQVLGDTWTWNGSIWTEVK
jgi:hypothetical protein